MNENFLAFLQLTDNDSCHIGKRSRITEKEDTRSGNGQLVESTNHGIGGGRSGTNAPG